MYFDEAAGALEPRATGVSVLLASAGILNVVLVFFAAPLLAAAQAAVAALAG